MRHGYGVLAIEGVKGCGEVSSSAVVMEGQMKVVLALETSTPVEDRRYSAMKGGLAAKGRNDAQGVTRTAEQSAGKLCTQAARTGGRLDIRDGRR